MVAAPGHQYQEPPITRGGERVVPDEPPQPLGVTYITSEDYNFWGKVTIFEGVFHATISSQRIGTLRSIYATCDMHGWIPSNILGGRRDTRPFSSGIPPPIFNDRHTGHPRTDGSREHPFTLLENVNRRFR